MGKSNFTLPPLSPLIGASFRNIVRVTWPHHIDLKYYPKVALTSVLTWLLAPARLADHLRFQQLLYDFEMPEPPLFLIGHWRSGTTHLHNVLCQDPRAGYVTTYQSVFPNLMGSQRWLKAFMDRFMPAKRPSDNVVFRADYPQEDEFALSNVSPYSYYHFMYFPREYRLFYQRFVRFQVPEQIRQAWKKDYLKLVKKSLLNTSGRRPVLKNPVNTARLDILRELFPEARFLYLYRNPVVVFLSTRRFFRALFPTIQLQKMGDEELTQLILDVYENLLKDYLEQREALPPNRLFELRFEDFEQRPLDELERLYAHLELEGFEDARPHFKRYLESQKAYRKNRYTIERSELERVLNRWGFAFETWNYQPPPEVEVIG